MPPYDTDEEQEAEMEMECVEVLAEQAEEEEGGDDDDENEEEGRDSTAVVAEADDSTEEDEDTDSEPEKEEPAVAVVAPPPRMRIKLKMPKATTTTASAANTTSGSTINPSTATKPPPAAQNDVVVSVVGGNKRKPNLPLKRVSPAGFLKKLPVTGGGGGGNDTSSVGGGSSTGKPKSRIRSLKLPLSKKLKEGDSGAEDEDTAVAEVVSSGTAATTTRTTPGGGTYTKRRSMHPSKPVKLPPLTSPGLIVSSSSGKSGSTTSAQLFDQAMQAAGYTETSRTERPHRGSSIRRTVGDLFDSNVKLTMHFPPMVPPDMWQDSKKEDEDGDVVMGDADAADDNKFTADDLIGQLRQTMRPSHNGNHVNNAMSFDEMIPVSLTMPLPESYIEERLEYVKLVEEREKAIVVKQEAEQDAEFNGTEMPKIAIPPIPVPPVPPHLEQVNTTTTASDKHPLYPPKQANLVAHLDPQLFHITEGRYYGLLSNNVADPNFCGPNALGSSAGNALATAGSSSTGTPITLSSVLFSSHPPALASAAAAVATGTSQTANNSGNTAGNNSAGAQPTPNAATSSVDAKSEGGGKASPVTAIPVASSNESLEKVVVVKAKIEPAKPPTKPSAKLPVAPKEKKKGLQPTASSSKLRKIMEEGGFAAENMRHAIIKAAIQASHKGGHGQAFVAPTGEVFPDIGKAFAAYAGIKPCERCKNNKQGSYHCRLRRKHQEPDFDGGDSWNALKDLLSNPVDSTASTVEAKTADD